MSLSRRSRSGGYFSIALFGFNGSLKNLCLRGGYDKGVRDCVS